MNILSYTIDNQPVFMDYCASKNHAITLKLDKKHKHPYPDGVKNPSIKQRSIGTGKILRFGWVHLREHVIPIGTYKM